MELDACDCCKEQPTENKIVGLSSYIGCKIINAKPMSQNEFNKEYKDGPYENCEDAPGYLVIYPDGYKSWSPKRVFEESYRMVSDKEKELIIR